jgi:5-methyltetrahydrofolate--homocysteine methyltransferase
MREYLAELTARGLATRWPVILGGAALNRAFVEGTLQGEFDGVVRYAKDAFEGLALMEPLVAIARGTNPALALPEPNDDASADPPKAAEAGRFAKRVKEPRAALATREKPKHSDGVGSQREQDVTRRAAETLTPPFWGTRIIDDVPLSELAELLDTRMLFRGSWKLPESEAEARLTYWLARIEDENLVSPKAVYGYFETQSEGDCLRVFDSGRSGMSCEATQEAARGVEDDARRSEAGPISEQDISLRPSVPFEFPRQRRGERLCLADFFAPDGDVLPIQLVTMGDIAPHTKALFDAGDFRDYYELHGLAMHLTEALAAHTHARIRRELGLPTDQGVRFSLGYPACPNLADRAKIVDLLEPERIGVTLSEGYQLHPEASTDAFVIPSPQAHYFSM